MYACMYVRNVCVHMYVCMRYVCVICPNAVTFEAAAVSELRRNANYSGIIQ